MRSIVWANCYLDSNDVIYSSFSHLGEILADYGMQLIMFSPAGDYTQHRGFIHFSSSVLVSDTGRTYRHFLSSGRLPMGSSGTQELLTLDQHWGGPAPNAEQELLILRALAFWERAFEIMQPAVILSWGSSVPTARLLARLGQRSQRPSYIMERGPIPKTIMLSLSGQVSLSGSTTYPALISPSFDEPSLSARWEMLREYLLHDFTSGYQDKNLPVPPDDALALHADAAPRVLFLGNFDTGSGCAFSLDELGDGHGGWIRSSEVAAHLVYDVLEQMNVPASFWVKPHPATRFTFNPTGNTCKVRNIPDWSIPTLVQAADICVTLTSTTQIYALLFNKPLVTLANGFMMGRDIAYEVMMPHMLKPMLERALRRESLKPRIDAGRALLAALCERDLFGLDDSVPTKLKMSDLAIMLGRFRHYVNHQGAEASRRIEIFQRFEKQALGVPADQ